MVEKKNNQLAIKKNFRALGTEIYVEIVLEGGSEEEKNRAKEDIQKIEELYQRKEDAFSRFKKESEVSLLNRNLGKFQKCSPDISYLAGRALFYNKLSDGLYDPRIIDVLERIGYDADFRKKDFSKMGLPPLFSSKKTKLEKDLKVSQKGVFFGRRMDFSGIAKGYITDCAAISLKGKGWKNFLIDSGGDMNISGKNTERRKWQIEIEGIPKERLTLEISDRGIATSGISRKKWRIKGKNFHHLVNPKDPNRFSVEVRTVSVVAGNTENADGRAKTLVLMGKKRGMEFAIKNKIAAFFLDYKGNVFFSPEAKKYIFVRDPAILRYNG